MRWRCLRPKASSDARSRPGPAQRRHREGGAAPGSPWRRHGDRRRRGYRGTSRTSRAPRHGRTRFAQMFASMPEVDHLGFGRQGLQEGPASAAPSAIATIPISGRARLMCSDFALQGAFSVSLPLSGMRPVIEGLQALALGVVEGDRAEAASRQEALARPIVAGSQRHHDAVEGDRGGGRVLAVCPRPHGCCPASPGRGSPSIRACSGSGAAGSGSPKAAMAPVFAKNAAASRAVQ